MKKAKKIGSTLFYIIIFGIVVYVIYVMSGINIVKPIENDNVSHIVKETTEESGERNTEVKLDEDYQKYVDSIQVSNFYNYTISYENIQLFSSTSNLISEGYSKATVFTFITKGGNDLITYLSSVDIYNDSAKLTPVMRFYEYDKDDVLIVVVVDNDKLDAISDEKNPLKVKLNVVDDSGNTYEKETTFSQSEASYDNSNALAGQFFKISNDGWGLRLDTATDTDAILRRDLVHDNIYYEFTTYINLFTFGSDDGMDLDKFLLDYTLESGLADFNDISITITNNLETSGTTSEYTGEDNLLCNKKVKIICTLEDTEISEDTVQLYKDSIDNASLTYDKKIILPLKNIIHEETTDIIYK